MRTYKVAVCRLGYAMVLAESEEEAIRRAKGLALEEIYWLGRQEQMEPFIVTYAEVQETS